MGVSNELNHLAVNAVFLHPKMGGLEKYVKRLIPELLKLEPNLEVSLFVNRSTAAELRSADWVSGVRVLTNPLVGVKYLSAASELTVLSGVNRRLKPDLLHSVAMTGPLWPGTPHVVTLADVIWIDHADPADRLTTTTWKLTIPKVAKAADRLITFSDSSREDIIKHIDVPAEKFDIVPLALDERPAVQPTPAAKLREELNINGRRVILTVSTKREHKNLLRLIKAFALLVKDQSDTTLVLPGNSTPHEEELKNAAAELRIADHVKFLNYVSLEDLEGLYSLAECFVFPSLQEGFGIPVLEAMGRDVPVACSNLSSLPEVAGDAAEYFDPYSETSIAEALKELLNSESKRSELVAAGQARAKQFTWQGMAEQTLASYRRTLANYWV